MAEAKYGTEVRLLMVSNDSILTIPVCNVSDGTSTSLLSLPSISYLSITIKLLVEAERRWRTGMGASVSSPVHWIALPHSFMIADPELTDLGKHQARLAHELWEEELKFDIPVPGKLYCSPLTRAIHTNAITFDSIISKRQKSMIIEV